MTDTPLSSPETRTNAAQRLRSYMEGWTLGATPQPCISKDPDHVAGWHAGHEARHQACDRARIDFGAPYPYALQKG